MAPTLLLSIYRDVRNIARVGDGYREEFGVGVVVHQGSVLSLMVSVVMLEALSRELRAGALLELPYAEDLMVIAESQGKLLLKVET